MRPQEILTNMKAEFVRLTGSSARRDRLAFVAELGLEIDAVHRFPFVN
jgi:hypothetical protein